MTRDDAMVCLRAGLIALAIILLAAAALAHASESYCPMLNAALSDFGLDKVKELAKARGYTEAQLQDAIRKCAASAQKPKS